MHLLPTTAQVLSRDFERIVFVHPTPPCSSRGVAETGGCGCGTEVPALVVVG